MKLSSSLFTLSLAAAATAAATPRQLQSRQNPAGVFQIILGQACEVVIGPGEDPPFTACSVEIKALNATSDTLGTGFVKSVDNEGINNVTDFCTTIETTPVVGPVSVVISGETWNYTLSECVSNTTITVEQEPPNGTSSTQKAVFKTAVTPADNDFGTWYNSFQALESAFVPT